MTVNKYFLWRRQTVKNSAINSRTLGWVKLAGLQQSPLVWKDYLWDLNQHYHLEIRAKCIRLLLFSNHLLLRHVKWLCFLFFPGYPFPRSQNPCTQYLNVWNVHDSASSVVQEGQSRGQQPSNCTKTIQNSPQIFTFSRRGLAIYCRINMPSTLCIPSEKLLISLKVLLWSVKYGLP